MTDYIEREAVETMLEDASMISDGEYSGYCTEDVCLGDIPAADVTPVRHGRWLEYENDVDRGYHYCSHCKRQAINYSDGGVITEILSPYCPNCGAKMDAED